MTPAADVDVAKLHAALDERVDGEVRFDPGTLGAYAQDASNYRQVPIGVVVPRTVDAAAAAVAVCREAGAPVLSRGGGTSLAGQCVNAAVGIDWTKYCHQMVSLATRCRWPVRSTGCGRPYGTRARRSPCWPTGSPAAPRSRPRTSAGKVSTWPTARRADRKPY